MKLSIVIPTRERAAFLASSLASATRIQHSDIEIVVSDNFSHDNTAAVVEQAADPRIRYVNTGRRVAMLDNFENGLRAATGDYIFFMGDDDGILPRQVPFLLELLRRHKPDNLHWHVPLFRWKRQPPVNKQGMLRVRFPNYFGGVREIDTAAYRRDLLNCDLKRIMPVPALYHGVVSREYLDQFKTPDGRFFNGHIPDYFFSYLAIMRGGRLMKVDHTFSVNGEGPRSTGAGMGAGAGAKSDGTPGEMFTAELRAHDMPDVLDTSLSVPMALFGTLETIRARYPFASDGMPDYHAWYSFVIDSMSGYPEDLSKAIHDELQRHAGLNGLETVLKSAGGHKQRSRRDAASLWRKLQGNAKSFVLRTEDHGEDNILTATEMLDHVLGGGYADVLESKRSRRALWRTCVRRARA